jgi:hypothetical protein
MEKQTEEGLLKAVIEIRNWIRAAAHGPVKNLLEAALPDAKTRIAYQMFDGTATAEQIRVACKMSPNAIIALANRCIAMGLMEMTKDKKRLRLFDLTDFGLIDDNVAKNAGSK